MKKCQYCGALLENSTKSCTSCGSTEFFNICQNCGTEYEGSKCPSCGTNYGQKAKKCPDCGKEYYSVACPNCGYIPGKEPKVIEKVVYVEKESKYERENSRVSTKSRFLALIICIYLGYFGLHHFYVGNKRTGRIYLFTFGLLGLGWFFDIFCILFGAFKDKDGYPLKHWI